jgi:flagellar biosynthesis protein FlhF
MQVKQFYSSSVEGALQAARAHLGTDAVLVASDMVPAPGWRGWMGQRVVAVTAAVQAVVDRGLSAVRPAASMRRQGTADAARLGVAARLSATGMDLALAERVAARLTPAECRSNSEAAILRALQDALTGQAAADADLAPIEVFVGPPGVGKTTTIAKIAAGRRAAGHRPPSLVAADGFRAGAVEHLRAYASIIGAPFKVARGPEALDEALPRSGGTTLVDTAGRPPSDPGFRDLWRVIAARRHVRVHLVMAAGTSVPSARRILASYAAAAPSRVVLTKLDEADSVAPLLAVLREQQLPVSWLASGQRIPEDLAVATAEGLAHVVLGAPEGGVACH